MKNFLTGKTQLISFYVNRFCRYFRWQLQLYGNLWQCNVFLHNSLINVGNNDINDVGLTLEALRFPRK